MMVLMVISVAEIFFMFFVEGLLASRRTEVIRLSIVSDVPGAVTGSMSM